MFATQSPDAGRARSAAGRLRTEPERLAALLRATGQGVLAAGLGRPRQARAAGAGRRRRARRAATPPIAERMARDIPLGHAALVPGAGHAAHLEQPDAFSRPTAATSSTSTSASASSSTDTPRPGPWGPAAAPVARRRQRGGDARVEQLQRGQPAVPARAARTPPAAARRRSPRGRRACSTGTARARPRGPSRSRLARRAEPAARGELHVDRRRRRSSLRGRAHVVGAWRPTRRRRSDTGTRARTSASSAERRAGLLHELRGRSRPGARSRSTACSTVHAPFASTRSAGQGPIASRTAATRSSSSGSPTLSLKQE